MDVHWPRFLQRPCFQKVLPTPSAWGHETECTFGVTRSEESRGEKCSPPQVTAPVSALSGLRCSRDWGGSAGISRGFF